MSPTKRRPAGTLRERGVLALGLGSALALLVTAFSSGSDPESAGRAALAQLAAHTGDAVLAEWNRLRSSAEPLGTPASDDFDLAEEPSASAALKDEQATAEAIEAESRSDAACGALLIESLRLEQAGDLDGARQAVRDALALEPALVQRLRAELRRIELASGPGEAGERPRWLHELAAQASGAHALPGIELGLRALIHVPRPQWDEVFALAAAGLVRRWCAPELRPYGARLERIGERRPYFALVRDVEAEALAARLAAACPLPDEALAALRERRRAEDRAALRAALGELPARGPDEAWELTPAQGAWFAARARAGGGRSGHFLARPDLERRLSAELERAQLLPEGVSLDFDGQAQALGPVIRARTALVGDELGFTLRHRDPEELVRSTSRKQGLLRLALVAMALFAAASGLLMMRALARARRLSELKTSFIANVSHELRTPLSSILLMAENLEAGRPAEAAGQARYHALIRREALRLGRLVDDVLDFSRLERGKRLDVQREPTPLAPLARDWAEEARAWAQQHGLELSFETRELPESALLDREALRRVLFNLLDNARKHSGSRRVEVELGRRGAQLCLSVSDHGRGIPPAAREQVFEPFARLDEGPQAAPGTGLGLAIVREIVHAHGGTISVRERAGGSGARFELCLPAAEDEEEAA